MKTLIIFNDCENLTYYIADGDYSKYNGLVFNASDDESELIEECCDWLWDENGDFQHDTTSDVSLAENKEWNKIAIITWVPCK